MSEQRRFEINGKIVWVRFISSGMGEADYSVQHQHGATRRVCKIWESEPDGGKIYVKYGMGREDTLTEMELIKALELYLESEHKDYLEWLEKNPGMKKYATV